MDSDNSATTRPQANMPPGSEQGARILRALRAHAKLSQRELATKAGLSASTVARAESGDAPPSWTSMVAAAAAAGCELWPVTGEGTRLPAWEFDSAHDRAGRHLPAHLEAWRVERLNQWWGRDKYSTWARPPVPEHTYRLREVSDDGD